MEDAGKIRFEKLQAALLKMDSENDNQWTIQGEAKLEMIKFLTGGESFTRDELNTLAPGFNREALRKAIQSGASNGQTPPPPPPSTGPIVTDDKPDDEPEQEKVELRNDQREAQIKALEQEIDRTDKAILEAQRVQAEVTARIIDLQAQKNKLNLELNNIKPGETAHDVFKAFHASMRSLAQKRAAARRTVVTSGIDVNAILKAAAPSGLDIALSSRPRRR